MTTTEQELSRKLAAVTAERDALHSTLQMAVNNCNGAPESGYANIPWSTVRNMEHALPPLPAMQAIALGIVAGINDSKLNDALNTHQQALEVAYNRAKYSRSVKREDFEAGWQAALSTSFTQETYLPAQETQPTISPVMARFLSMHSTEGYTPTDILRMATPSQPEQSAADVCPKCSQSWDEHEMGVPAPYCPTPLAPATQPDVLPGEKIDELRALYNDHYCEYRKNGVAGGEAERLSMRDVVNAVLALPSHKPSSMPSEIRSAQAVATIQALIDSHKRDTNGQCDESCDIVAGMEAARDALSTAAQTPSNTLIDEQHILIETCAKICQRVIDSGEYDGHQQYAAAACRDAILSLLTTPRAQQAELANCRIFMDESDAARFGEAFIARAIEKVGRHQCRELLRSETTENHGAQMPRVKWIALFDTDDRLRAGYILTRDALNWTQVSLLSPNLNQGA